MLIFSMAASMAPFDKTPIVSATDADFPDITGDFNGRLSYQL